MCGWTTSNVEHEILKLGHRRIVLVCFDLFVLARKLHTTFTAHRGPVPVVRYAKRGAKYIPSGGQDRTIRLWNLDSGTEIKTFEARGYEVLSISVSHEQCQTCSLGWGQVSFRVGHGNPPTVEFNADASGSYVALHVDPTTISAGVGSP